MRIEITGRLQAMTLLLLSVCGERAAASVVFYTNQSAFNAATASLTSFGFNSLVTGSGSVAYDTAAGVTVSGFNFVGPTGTPSKPYLLGAVGPSFYFNDYNRVPGASSLQGPGTSNAFYDVTKGSMTITMPTGGVTAFGIVVFDVLIGDTTGAGTDTVNLTAGGSTGSVVTPAHTGTAFIGFTSTTPITSVTLTGTTANEFPTISSVYYGSVAGALASPTLAVGGIVPLYSTAATIQPGEWVSIYGTNLAGNAVTWAGNFPTSLGGTSVTINGKSAYLWFVSPTQINLQAPDDSATGSVPVVVTTAGGTATSTVTLAQFGPSFSLLDSKHVTGIILRSDGSGTFGGGTYDIIGPTGTSLGFPTIAAKTGDSVVLFGVGFGPTNPAVPAGQLFSGSAPTTNAVKLLINNMSVIPFFAGLSSAGLYQINLTLPAGLGAGDVPLIAAVGGVQTPSNVVISVQ